MTTHDYNITMETLPSGKAAASFYYAGRRWRFEAWTPPVARERATAALLSVLEAAATARGATFEVTHR